MSKRRVWRPDEEQVLIDWLTQGKDYADVATKLDRTEDAVRLKASTLGVTHKQVTLTRPSFTIEKPPSAGRDFEQLFKDRLSSFERKAAHHKGKKDIGVHLEGDGPYLLLAFGDPHVDDDGSCLATLNSHMEIANQPDVFAFNIGDLTNNWVGNLQRLYGVQETTIDDAKKLCRWLVGSVNWLWIILGNHDKWSDMAQMVCEEKGVCSVSHGGIFNITRGGHTLKIDARHDHKGRSMYNPAHGQIKRNHRGSDADIIIAGHTHSGGYTRLKNGVTGKIGHMMRVGAYKMFDDYADASGFDNEALTPCLAILVDPFDENEPITIYDSPEKGHQMLELLRSKYELEEHHRRIG